MTIACPSCAARLAIPDDKAQNPKLKLQCPGCKTIFPIGGSAAAGAAAASPGRGASPSRSASAPRSASGALSAPAALRSPGVRPAEVSPAAAVAAAADPSSSSGARRAAAAASPLVCANHPKVKSESICSVCLKGFCRECGKRVQNAVLCPLCEHLCTPAGKYAEEQETARRRARPMRRELGSILLFPFTEPVSYIIVTVIVSALSLNDFAGLFARGLLMAATFHQVHAVSSGKRRLSMPDVSDVTDLLRPVWLGLGVFLVSWGPLLAFAGIFSFKLLGGFAALDLPPSGFPFEGAAQAQDYGGGGYGEYQEQAEGMRRWITFGGFFMLLGIGWKLFYSPVALMVAALSQSFTETLKPWVGMTTIRRMGPMYGELLAIYTLLMLAQFLVSLPFAGILIVGRLVRGVTDVYAYLAAGAAIGMAVEKKAEELGLE